jgi:hypothetical protein
MKPINFIVGIIVFYFLIFLANGYILTNQFYPFIIHAIISSYITTAIMVGTLLIWKI